MSIDAFRSVYASVISRLAALGFGDLIKAWTPDEKTEHWRKVNRIAQEHEPGFRDAARQVFNEQMRGVLAAVGEARKAAQRQKASIDWQQLERDVYDYLDEAGDLWREAFIPQLEGLITDQGEYWSLKLGFQFNIQNLRARDWFNRYTLIFAQEVNQTTKDGLGKLFAQAQEEGWSIPRTQNHIEEVFEQWMFGEGTSEDFDWYAERMPPYRTEMIARTETIRASNSGTNELYKEWGVQRREWISTRDDRTRTIAGGDEFDHLAMDGVIVGINEPFKVPTASGGFEELMYPGDPAGSAGDTINCRCTTAAVIED